MVFLIISILFSTLILITFRIFTKFNINNLQAIIINYITAVILGIIILNRPIKSYFTLFNYAWFYYSILIAVFFIITFFLFAISSQKAGIAITAVSSKVSLVIPIIASFFILNEQLSTYKIVGIITACIAFYLTFKKDKKNSNLDLKFIYFPLLLFVCNGINDALMKIIETKFVAHNTLLFLTCIFFFAFLIGIITLILKEKGIKFKNKNILAGFLLGLINFGSTYYFLESITEFDSSVFFPSFNASVVTLSAIVGYLIFKEKLKPINIIGIVLAVFSIIFIALN